MRRLKPGVRQVLAYQLPQRQTTSCRWYSTHERLHQDILLTYIDSSPSNWMPLLRKPAEVAHSWVIKGLLICSNLRLTNVLNFDAYPALVGASITNDGKVAWMRELIYKILNKTHGFIRIICLFTTRFPFPSQEAISIFWWSHHHDPVRIAIRHLYPIVRIGF